MKDKQYYPTPEDVIKIMLEPYIKEDAYYRKKLSGLNDKFILDPSAGEGAILDYLNENGVRNEHLYAIDVDDDFKHTLADKNYNVIGSDFLEYKNDMFLDFIIMNPPFNEGAKHLLKAWNILYEGDIVCLLNNETLLNPYTKERAKLAHIIKEHGETQFLGNVFKDAPITASVDVVLVRLHKEKKEDYFKFDTNFKQAKDNFSFDKETFENMPATQNELSNLIIHKENAEKAFIEFIKAYKKLDYYFSPINKNSHDSTMKVISTMFGGYNNTPKMLYNEFTAMLKRKAWNIVLKDSDIEEMLTHELKQNFNKFITQQQSMEFSVENVVKIIEMLVFNRDNIMKDAVISVFDTMTRFHAKNKVDEGWKTNDSWKVNKKVIIPWGVSYGRYLSATSIKDWGAKFDIDWGDNNYSDIDKVMCYLTGRNYKTITSIDYSMRTKFDFIGNVKPGDKFDNTTESTFFNIKFWKKGTVHLTFKDNDLWERFNIEAAKGKNWLPDYEEPKQKKSNPVSVEDEQLVLF